jgi:hypothetical protein
MKYIITMLFTVIMNETCNRLRKINRRSRFKKLYTCRCYHDLMEGTDVNEPETRLSPWKIVS